jgi:AraC-like DNA-binding protein
VVEPVERDSRGILHPRRGLERFRLDRVAPGPDVGRFIDRYWIASWALPDGESHEQHILVHPVVNIVATPAGATVGGVSRRRFTQNLTGTGRVLGVMSRPGGFAAYVDTPVSELTDRTLPLTDVVPGAAHFERQVGAALRAGVDGPELTAIADDALAATTPGAPHPCEETIAWAESIAHDRDIVRVDDLARAVGVSIRALQRRFAEHVGVSPKWVIRRYRLYEIAERAARDEAIDWAELAARLGYADQAHLVRDFTRAVGQPPERYARAARQKPSAQNRSQSGGRATTSA